jgi:multidrug resistance protein
VHHGSSRSSERPPLPPGFWTLWTTVAIDLVGFGIVVPILGRYAERFGANGLQVGLLFAAFSLAQLVFSPILGRLSDRVGRKPVIVVSLVGTAIGSVVTGAASALWMLFLGRVIDGASGASVAVAQAAVSDLAPPQERARLLGLLGAAFGVGFVVGPALGGLAALGGPHVPFYLAAVIAGANAIAAAVRLPETRRPTPHPRPATRRAAGPRSAMLVRLAVVGFVSVFAFAGFEATFSLFGAERFDLTEGSTAFVFLGVGLVTVVVQGMLIGPLTARFGSGRLLRAGLALTGLGLVVLAGATTWALLAVSLGLLAVGQGLASPSIASLVVSSAGDERRGEALGFQQSAYAFARVGGPVVAGALFDVVGIPAPYLLAAGLCGVSLALLVLWHPDRTPGRDDGYRTPPDVTMTGT